MNYYNNNNIYCYDNHKALMKTCTLDVRTYVHIVHTYGIAQRQLDIYMCPVGWKFSGRNYVHYMLNA